MNKGKLIVIEGSDGSGKSTQLELLKKYFEQTNIKFKSIKFPRYDSFFGKTIASFLRGDLGPLANVNPYLISMVYAMDRADAKIVLDSWLAQGKMVVMDRYATSNMAHQYGRLPEDKREHFLQWILELEYEVNKIPKEDLVIFLHVPYQVSQKLMESKDRNGKDMVEKDAEYLKNSEETYVQLAQHFSHWVTIECVDKKGNMRNREEIHEEIISLLKEKEII